MSWDLKDKNSWLRRASWAKGKVRAEVLKRKGLDMFRGSGAEVKE